MKKLFKLLKKPFELMLGCQHEFEVDSEMVNGTLWRFCTKCGCRQKIDSRTGDWYDF